MNIQPINENTLIIYFSENIETAVADKIARVIPFLRQHLGSYIIDVIPSYTSILITIDLIKIGLREIINKITYFKSDIDALTIVNEGYNEIIIPVYYGLEVAWDAENLTRHSSLPFEKIIEIHSTTVYRVYAIGFAPGFAYLGNTDPRIAIPRQSTPRMKVPAGSVAIADQQTAIYPRESPGGWQIIGRTPIELIDYQRENLCLFEMGALIRFQPISKEKFISLGGILDTSDSNFISSTKG